MNVVKSFSDLGALFTQSQLNVDARLRIKAAFDGTLTHMSPRNVEQRRVDRAMAAPVDNTPLFTGLPPRHVGVYRTEPIRRAQPRHALCLEDTYCLAHPRVAAAMYAAWNEGREFELI